MKGVRTHKTIITLRSTLLLLSVIALCACNNRQLYNESQAIPTHGWHIEEPLTFNIENPAPQTCDIELFIRHTTQYNYRNLWLFVEHTTPDSTITTDTINITLANKYGKWEGGGWGSHHQVEYPLYSKLPLDSGMHTIKITQGMREIILKDIANVGISVEKVSK